MAFWILAAVFGALFVVTLLLVPQPRIEQAKAADFGDFDFPRAEAGDPVPYIAGTVRIRGPNLVWYGDYSSHPVYQKRKQGLGNVVHDVIGHNYFVGMHFVLALSRGTAKLRTIWFGKHKLFVGTLVGGQSTEYKNLTLNGPLQGAGGFEGQFTFYNGSPTQTPDAYLTAKLENGASQSAYRGVAGVVIRGASGSPPSGRRAHYNMNNRSAGRGANIGGQNTLQSFNFEITIIPNPLGLTTAQAELNGGYDANPANVLYDVVTNSFALLGFSAGDVDTSSFVAAGITLANENHGVSLKQERATEARKTVEEILSQIDGLMYEDPLTRKIVLKLVRADYVVADLPVFDENNVISLTDFKKTQWSDTYNEARLVYEDRADEYRDRTAFTQDLANWTFQGNRIRSMKTNYVGVKTAALANSLINRELALISIPIMTAKINTNRQGADLRPGDVIRFRWPEYGIVEILMRIRKINRGTLKDGVVTLELAQDRFGVGQSVFADPAPSGWAPFSAVPVAVAEARVVEASYFMLALDGAIGADSGNLMVYAIKPNEAQQSFKVWEAPDGGLVTDYEPALDEPFTFGQAGLLLNTLPVGSDIGGSMVINTLQDFTNFEDATDSELRNEGVNLVLVNDEIIGFLTTTVPATGQLQLTTLYRGLMDTVQAEHPAGSRVFLYTKEFLTGIEADTAEDIDIRLQTTTAEGELDLVVAPVINVTKTQRSQRPYPPARVTFNGSSAPVGLNSVSTPISVVVTRRDRLKPTLSVASEPDETPEEGTDIVIRFGPTGTEFEFVQSPGNATFDWQPTEYTGPCIINVFQRRNGLLSRHNRSITTVLTTVATGAFGSLPTVTMVAPTAIAEEQILGTGPIGTITMSTVDGGVTGLAEGQIGTITMFPPEVPVQVFDFQAPFANSFLGVDIGASTNAERRSQRVLKPGTFQAFTVAPGAVTPSGSATSVLNRDANSSTVTLASGQTSRYMAFHNLLAGIPTGASITGIEVVVGVFTTTGTVDSGTVLTAQLGLVTGTNTFTAIGGNFAAGQTFGPYREIVLGTPNSVPAAITVANANNTQFGVLLQFSNPSGVSQTVNVDTFGVRIYYEVATNTATAEVTQVSLETIMTLTDTDNLIAITQESLETAVVNDGGADILKVFVETIHPI